MDAKPAPRFSLFRISRNRDVRISSKFNTKENSVDAKITKGYNLPAKYVIHTVGPVWSGGKNNEQTLLKSCYLKSLELAAKNKIKTIAFPCISTGVYRFPKDKAATIAIAAVHEALETFPLIEKVIFVCFSKDDLALYQDLLKEKINIVEFPFF